MMSATNKRVRRSILFILWEHGAMTKEDVAVKVGNMKGIEHVPSPHSLSALLSKTKSVIVVGKKQVLNYAGQTALHNLYDIDREIIQDEKEIVCLLEPSVMSPDERKEARKCLSCGRTRIFLEGHDECIHCVRTI